MKWSYAAAVALSLGKGVRSQFLVEPETPADPNTIKDCTWPCTRFPLVLGNSYCIEQNWGQAPVLVTTTTTTSAKPSSTLTTLTSTTTSRSSTITTPPPTTTTTVPGNGVSTPSPIQTGMVGNCNKFHWVEKEQSCATIAAQYSISASQFLQWNPAVKSDCTGLWASTWACVGTLGTPTATTTAGNGITTPSPIQPGMVTTCNKFYRVNAGDTCDAVAFWGGAPGTQWVKQWNPAVGSDCRGLQANTYACVGVISGNGISTPLPTQTGMVKDCNKFYHVNSGDTCDAVAFWGGAPGTQWVIKWNPAVGAECRTLQAGTYACVGIMQ
ncbi:hypothetical protein C8A05DRAFT_48209 [Staphylotrichum tortipilum]|uniref:LysM domain-containing protein n=1 Tax=Staphylotrichum tortipilum TaxID=2831512 RepID=A0AAN6MAT1_9PEZI|nr:hypothetical protein C8A05DRAFT_48209 [Staphylotrichum longicolle]